MAPQFGFTANLLPTELLYNTAVTWKLEMVGVWWVDREGFLGRQVDLKLLIA